MTPAIILLLAQLLATVGPMRPADSADTYVDDMSDYLEAATLSWMNLPTEEHARDVFAKQELESVETVQARIHDVAAQVAKLLAANGAESFWKSDVTRARTGLLMMSVAFNESRFRGYVDDGRCNDVAWRSTEEASHLLVLGTCDWDKVAKKAMARTIWQMQGAKDIAPSDHFGAALVAYSRIRTSIKQGGDLRLYTGEWMSLEPKASRVRLGLADRYFRAHPPTMAAP